MKADDGLVELALGILPQAEQGEAQRRLATSASLRGEVAGIAEALARIAEGLPPVAPSARGRARLLAALSGPDRFRPFFAALASHFDLTVEHIRDLLSRIDDPSAWEATPMSWIKLMHFAGGPALGTADAGFLRIAAGATFPRHSHGGPELTFVLEGAMTDGAGRYGPGATLAVTAADTHELQVEPGADLVAMVWHHGVTFDRG